MKKDSRERKNFSKGFSRFSRLLGTGLIVATAALLFSQRADAKVLEIWLQGQGGGMYGFYGTEKFDPATDVSVAQDDFFQLHSGGTFGFQLGVEVFFVDVIIDFAQFYNDNGLSATLTCFMLGFDWDFSLSKRWELTPYGMGGFALGTYNNSWLEKEKPQIAFDDLQARGVLARVGARLEFKLHEMLRIGVDAGAGYHYMLQTDKTANDLDGHSHGFHGYVMGIVRFQWEPFKKKKKEKKVDDFYEDHEPEGVEEGGGVSQGDVQEGAPEGGQDGAQDNVAEDDPAIESAEGNE